MSGAGKDKHEEDRAFFRGYAAGTTPRRAGRGGSALPVPDYIGGDEVWIGRNTYAGWRMMSCQMNRSCRGSQSISCALVGLLGQFAGMGAWLHERRTPERPESG